MCNCIVEEVLVKRTMLKINIRAYDSLWWEDMSTRPNYEGDFSSLLLQTLRLKLPL